MDVIQARLMGQRIQKLMEEKNISVEELAAKMGVDPSAVSKWMNGNRGNCLDSFLQIVEVLETSADYLLFGENPDTGIVNESASEQDQFDSVLKETTISDIQKTKETVVESAMILNGVVSELQNTKENQTASAFVLEQCVSEIKNANKLNEDILESQDAIRYLLSRTIAFVKVVIILVVGFFVLQNCPLFNQAFPEPLTWWITPILVVFMFLVDRHLLTGKGTDSETTQ